MNRKMTTIYQLTKYMKELFFSLSTI